MKKKQLITRTKGERISESVQLMFIGAIIGLFILALLCPESVCFKCNKKEEPPPQVIEIKIEPAQTQWTDLISVSEIIKLHRIEQARAGDVFLVYVNDEKQCITILKNNRAERRLSTTLPFFGSISYSRMLEIML